MNELEESHPLSAWWNQILLKRIKTGLKDVEKMVHSTFKVLKQVNEDVQDLNLFLKEHLELTYEETCQKFLWTETLIPPSLAKIIQKDGSIIKILATLIAITICQNEIQEAVGQMAGE